MIDNCQIHVYALLLLCLIQNVRTNFKYHSVFRTNFKHHSVFRTNFKHYLVLRSSKQLLHFWFEWDCSQSHRTWNHDVITFIRTWQQNQIEFSSLFYHMLLFEKFTIFSSQSNETQFQKSRQTKIRSQKRYIVSSRISTSQSTTSSRNRIQTSRRNSMNLSIRHEWAQSSRSRWSKSCLIDHTRQILRYFANENQLYSFYLRDLLAE